MVAQAMPPPSRADVRLVSEVRGAPARLFDGAYGEVVIAGSAGTGKTRGILEYIHRRCATEKIRVLFLRKTLESLKSSALVTFQEQVLYRFDGKQSVLDGVTYFGGNNIRPAQFTYVETGSTIMLGGLDNPSKVLSTEWDIVYVNEVVELSLNDWEMVTGRTDRPSMDDAKPPSLVIGDCNPDAPNHWIKLREAEGKLQLWTSYHEDNPAMWDRSERQWTASGKRYIETRLDVLTGVRYQRLRLGKWVAAEGQVYDNWNAKIHLVDSLDPKDFRRKIGSADWGYTNPAVLQVWGVDGDDRMGMLREVYQTRKTIDWVIERAKELTVAYGVETWYCDPSEPAYIEQFRSARLNAEPAVNDILPGINAVQQRLKVAEDGRVRLVVARDAFDLPDPDLIERKQPTNTVQEIDSYVWARKPDGTMAKEKPVDAFNHGCDSMRYAVMGVDHGISWSDYDTAGFADWLAEAGAG